MFGKILAIENEIITIENTAKTIESTLIGVHIILKTLNSKLSLK